MLFGHRARTVWIFCNKLLVDVYGGGVSVIFVVSPPPTRFPPPTTQPEKRKVKKI
jgi:hypothetical protein